MADAVPVAARLVLGVVFVVAAVMKLRDPGWPDAARRFAGLPRPLAWGFAVVELVLGALLAAQFGAAAWAALALLAVSTAFVVGHLVRATGAPCACFGSAASARPVTWRTVARNVALAFLAVAAAA